MTAPERAQYLITELGHSKAEEHALWVANGSEKSVTRDYWYSVLREIKNDPIVVGVGGKNKLNGEKDT